LKLKNTAAYEFPFFGATKKKQIAAILTRAMQTPIKSKYILLLFCVQELIITMIACCNPFLFH
jgi:hypothetical protein